MRISFVLRGGADRNEGQGDDWVRCAGAALLRELIEEGQRQFIGSFMQTAGLRCAFAEELGGAKGAAEWANDGMRWFVEEAEALSMNERLIKQGGEFADAVPGKRL